MNRSRQTNIQRQRTSGVIRTKRVPEGHWDLVFADKRKTLSWNFPLISLERWCMPHSYSLRKYFLRRKR